MAQSLVPVSKLDRGIPFDGVAADGDAVTDTVLTWFNSGYELLLIHNGDVGAITATLAGTPDRDGRSLPDQVCSIAAGDTGVFPMMAPHMFNLGDNPSITLSAITSVTALLFTQRKAAV